MFADDCKYVIKLTLDAVWIELSVLVLLVDDVTNIVAKMAFSLKLRSSQHTKPQPLRIHLLGVVV